MLTVFKRQGRKLGDQATLLFLRARNRIRGERGADFVEYALILAAVVIVAMGAYQVLGGNIAKKVQDVASSLG